jgi:hypothetical protein
MNTTNDRWDVKLEDAPPVKKGGIPGWIWGCGGGCLFVMVALSALTWWFVSKVQELVDPENAWPEIAKIMPYGPVGPDGTQTDHTAGRPPGVVPMVFPVDNFLFRRMISDQELAKIPVDFVILMQPTSSADRPVGTGTNAMLIVFRERVENPLETVVESPFFAQLVVKADATESRGPGEETFQGRAVTTHHIAVDAEQVDQQVVSNGEGLEDLLFVDITGDRERSVVVFATGTGESTGSIEELEELLAPFRVWEGK